jgi:lipopolysaccharide transport system permease protein
LAEAEKIADTLPAVVEITPQGARLGIDWRDLWEHRELLYFLVWRDIKVRYKQTLIGIGWAVLQPVLTMLIFTLFFGKLAKIPSSGLPYPIFYYAGLLPWTYFATALGSVTSSVVDHQHAITRVYFPRLILPLAGVLPALVDFAISFVLLAGMMVYYHITPGLAVLALPAFLLLAVLTALAAGLWLAALNAMYRDVRYIIPFVIQFWMFASPVVYPSSLVPAKWRWVFGLNPMTGVIESFRWSLTGHGQPPSLMLLASVAAVLALLAGGLIFYQRMEGTIADIV